MSSIRGDRFVTTASEKQDIQPIHHLLADQVRRRPDALAVSGNGVRISYGELDMRSERLASRLTVAGVGAEDIVGVMVDKTTPDFVVAACAAWKIGAVYMPVDPRTPVPQTRRMLEGTGPAALVGSVDLVCPYSDLCSTTIGTDTTDALGARPRLPDVSVAQLAYIVHTSGSTGVPKPVAMSHRALVSLFLGWRECYGLDSAPPRWLQAASPSFDVHIGDMARALLSGGTLVLCPTEFLLDPVMFAALIDREHVECMDLTPTVLTLLADHLERTGRRLPSLRLIICGGEQMMTMDYRRWRRALGPDVRIVNAYGVSEGGVESTLVDVTEHILDEDVVPIGRPLPGAAIAVLDGAMRRVRPGSVGELYIAGDRVADGYYNRPDLTRERFPATVAGLPGPRMYRTGDLVRQRPDGCLVFLGRSDDEVKIRGIRVLLGSVEAALLEHPRVRQAVAVRTDRSGEDTLVAHVVLDDEGQGRIPSGGTATWLRDDMASRVVDAMVPAHVIVHDRLPLNRSGKVDRKALSLLWPTTSTEAMGAVTPKSPAERAVFDAWTRVLGCPPADRAENLFTSGGTSLTAARLATLLGGQLSVGSVFSAPAFADIVHLLESVGEPFTETTLHKGNATTATLAPGQRGLWLQHQVRGDDVAYHLPTVLRLTGRLDVGALRRALDNLLARHDALRTAIVSGVDGPVLEVAAPMTFPLRMRADRSAVDELIREPFDLTRAPLIRGALIRYEEHRHELVLVAHHLIFDDWSERILLRELAELYSSFTRGTEPATPAPRTTYLELARLRASRSTGDSGRRQREYWKQVLADLPTPLDLPAVVDGGGTAAPFTSSRTLSAELTDRVRAAASAHGTTPYVVLLAAFGSLLHRWCDQEDLLVGAPFGYRDRPETQDLVGFLVSTLPLRLSFPDGATFAQVIASTHEALTGAMANAEVAFDQLVHDAGRTNRAAPMFRTWFNWLGSPVDPPDMAGLSAEVEHLTVPGALFDLSIYVTDAPTGFRLDLVADYTALDLTYLPELLRQYVSLVEHLCTTPDVAVRRPALPPGQQEQAGTDLARPSAPFFPGLVEIASSQADRVAVTGPDGSMTYAQLRRYAGAVSETLRKAGVRAGDVIAVYARRCSRLVPAMLGVLGAGAAFALLDRGHPVERLAAQVRQAGAQIGLAFDEVPEGLSVACERWVRCPVGEASGWPLATGPIAYVSFTSGTTGVPKKVIGGFEPLENFLSWYPERFGITVDDRFAMIAGLSHDPLLRDVFVPLWTGATLCVPPADFLHRAVDLLAWLRAERVTVLHVTPALARMLAATDGPPAPDIRLVVCGGDAMVAGDMAMIRRWAPGSSIVNAYGTTETPQVVSLHDVDTGERRAARVPVGTGAPGAELLVLDRYGRPTAVGETGAVEVRGPYLASGEPERVPGHLRFTTGDRGRRGSDGTVTILGRADDQVQVRGFRVELAEIDRLLREHPYVADAASQVTAGPDGENQVIAYVVARTPETTHLVDYLRTKATAYMIPSRIVRVGSIPLTPNGKPDREALRPPAVVRAEGPLPSSELERTVGAVWQRVLAVAAIGADQNFFDLGATSLLLTRAHVDLQAALGRAVPITALFEHTTVRRLAAYLADEEPAVGHIGRQRG